MARRSRLGESALALSPAFEMLEDRLLFAAQPVVTVSGGGDALIGETAHVTVSFDNVPDGSGGGDVGFAPYVDLILPTNGADGGGPGNSPVNDGLTFQGATYLGQSVQATSIEFDVNGEALHPFARDAGGQLRVVHASDYGAQPGDTLVTMQLPFGSFAPDQPPADIDVSLGVSNLADLNTPLSISAVGGFAFGRDALNNPTTDAPVLGPASSSFVNPTLLTISKTSNLPEGETATGPSYPHQWTVTIDIATGQAIDNLVLTDLVPDGVVITGASASGATTQIDPATNEVVATFASPVTGVVGNDVTMTIDFHIGEFLGPGDPLTPVLDPATGAPRTLENNASASADWTPVDPRDSAQTFVVDPQGPENVIVAKALAIQKTAAVIGGGPATPGDAVEWTIRAQVSDYFNLDQLTLNDILSDGQTFDPNFTPTLVVTEQGGPPDSTGPFALANFVVARPAATTSLVFDVGGEMAARGFDSVLSGGGGAGAAPTEIVVTFRTTVDSNYSTGAPVLHDDAVTNTLNGQAQNTAMGGGTIADNSSAEAPIAPGRLDGKTVYAINGALVDPSAPPPLVSDGDVVTFRLQYTVPMQSADSLVLTDFLPLPIFAAVPIAFQDVQRNDAPPAGVAWFRTTDTLDAVMPTSAVYQNTPRIVVNAASNSVAFEYGDFTLPDGSGTRQIDILFSVEVADEPFGDGLRFNNLVQASEVNSSGQVTTGVDAGEVILSQPQLSLQKGIVASTNPDSVYSPTPAAPLTFTTPGSAGVRFSGTLSSDLLATDAFDSDVSQVDAGDIVTYAIVVENSGSGANGAFDILIRDVLAPGFAVPTGGAGLNVQVTDGAGNALAFTGDLFTTGISLVDPSQAAGALAPANPTSGANILVITYDVQLIDTVATPNQVIENEASIANYAAEEGGTNFAQNLLPEDREASATATTAGPLIAKAVVATSLPESAGSTVFIGEEVFYDVTVTLAEGTLEDFVFTDSLPSGPGGKVALLDAGILSVGSNISFQNAPGPIAGADSNGDGVLDRIVVDFGDTANAPDNVRDADDQIVIRIHGVVPDIPENNSGDVLTNTARVDFTDGAGVAQSIDASAPITIGVPGPTIVKTADRTTVDAGDTVSYTVVISNPVVGGVAAPVFDLLAADTLSSSFLTLVAGSVTVSSPTAVVLTGNGAGDQTISVAQDVLQPGKSLTITYQAVVSSQVVAGQVLTNTAVQRSDSAPGPVPEQRVFISSDDASVNVATPALVKTVVATDLADTGAAQGDASLQDLAFGETVTFSITATMPEGSTLAASLVDELPFAPGSLQALSATITSVGSNLTIGSGAGVGSSGTLSDRNADGVSDTAAFSLGDVTNVADGKKFRGWWGRQPGRCDRYSINVGPRRYNSDEEGCKFERIFAGKDYVRIHMQCDTEEDATGSWQIEWRIIGGKLAQRNLDGIGKQRPMPRCRK